MSRIIDFHTHILCGVDHGSSSLDTSAAQLQLIKKNGTDAVVATSHFYPEKDSVDSFLESVSVAEGRILPIASELGLELYVGAEVLVCSGLDRMEGIDRLCVRGTRCLLLEIPFVENWVRGAVDTIERIIDNGYTVVLAHVDRYLSKHEKDIDYLISAGALAQINASAFSSIFSKKKLLTYIDEDIVYALGSDIHEEDTKAYKDFVAARKRITDERFERIMDNTESLLANATRSIV